MRSGEVVGDRFEIDRVAGTGGMGVVYRALDRHSDGLAAIKVLRSPDPQTAERFAREARALAELRHPGIVRYLGHGRGGDGELWLAMEWLEGEDLAQRLVTGELTPDETLAFAAPVAAALGVAHARRIVHRDIKPSNIFLVDWTPRRVKLLDFGVARLVPLAPLTESGYLVGTPLYMAPEQARGSRAVDARADVFALGAVLYRCLTGRAPFGGETVAEIVSRLLSEDEAPRASSLAPATPPMLDDLVARMLTKDPAARPADGAAVLGELFGLEATGAPAPSRGSQLGSGERRAEVVVRVAGRPDGELRARAAAHGGFVDEIGEESGADVVVRFGGPGLPSDHAQRAARFALAQRARSAAVSVRLGRVDDGGAPPSTSGVRIDDAAAGLVAARFDLAGDDAGLVLVGERGIEHAARPLLGRATPFVGRERELALLDAAFADCVENEAARAVLVVAPAGTGKSRLRQEWLARLRGAEVWAAHGDPMRAGAPFGLLGEAVRRAAGIMGGEPLDRSRELLEARAGPEVAPFLGEIAGVPFPGEDHPQLRAARRDPSLFAEQLAAAFSAWVDKECARQPVALVLEDLHWGDLPTVKLCDAALGALAERPFLVLGLARPEVTQLFPQLWEQRGLQRIHLGALPRKACERLVHDVLGPDVEGAAIVERAQGNAFFLEELIRHVAERRGSGFPDTVLAMASARFMSLEAELRRALRAASVFGDVFFSSGVAALLGVPRDGVDAALDELVELEMVSRRRVPRFAGERELAFRHSLLREAAYAMLTDEDRAIGHRLAGAWLEGVGEDDARVLAEHFERGGARVDAARCHARAAVQALAGSDAEAVLQQAARAVAAGAQGEELGAVHLTEATAYRMRGMPREAGHAACAAMLLLPPRGEAWFDALGQAISARGLMRDLEDFAALIVELEGALGAGSPPGPAAMVAIARAAGQAYILGEAELGGRLLARLDEEPVDDLVIAAWIEEARSFRGMLQGYGQYRRIASRSAELHAAAGNARAALQQRNVVMFTHFITGRCEDVLAESITISADAERLGMLPIARLATGLRGLALLHLGRTDEAAAEIERSAQGIPPHPRVAVMILYAQGQLHEARGEIDDAEAAYRRALDQGAAALPNDGMPRIALAHLLVMRGRPEESLEVAREWRATHDPTRLGRHHAFVALAEGEALAALGRRDEARAKIALARRQFGELTAGLEEAEREQAYVRVPELARVVALARELDVQD